MPDALIRVVARIHGGPSDQNVTIHRGYTVQGPNKVYDGDPRYHLAIAFRKARAAFSYLEGVRPVNSGSSADCYAMAVEEVRATLPGVFALDTNDVLPAHYWNGERWVKLGAGAVEFAHGYLIWKGGRPYTEIVTIGPDDASAVPLEMDFLVTVHSASLG